MNIKTLKKDIENIKRITDLYNDLLQQLLTTIQNELEGQEIIEKYIENDIKTLKDISSAKKRR